MDRVEMKRLSSEIWGLVFNLLDASESFDSKEAGRIATKLERVFLAVVDGKDRAAKSAGKDGDK